MIGGFRRVLTSGTCRRVSELPFMHGVASSSMSSQKSVLCGSLFPFAVKTTGLDGWVSDQVTTSRSVFGPFSLP